MAKAAICSNNCTMLLRRLILFFCLPGSLAFVTPDSLQVPHVQINANSEINEVNWMRTKQHQHPHHQRVSFNSNQSQRKSKRTKLNLVVPEASSLLEASQLVDSTIYLSAAEALSTSATMFSSSVLQASSGLLDSLANIDKDSAEALAGPFFGASLFPYLAFLYFLNRPENETPKGVVVGFSTCLLFVFLTIPAAIAAKVLYGVSLADCDWLHGSAESLLTITNLVTVIPFRQALAAKQREQQMRASSGDSTFTVDMPQSAKEYGPMIWWVAGFTALATATVVYPALSDPTVHTPYLSGFMDLPLNIMEPLGANPEPENALTVATWIIHVSSLVEFLVAMGFCWRWADIVENPRWKGLTWGLIPLHSSGITACVSHLFYNKIAILVPLQAFLTCVGNTTAAWAAFRIAQSNGWKPQLPEFVQKYQLIDLPSIQEDDKVISSETNKEERQSLVGFEDLGEALANDNDYTFLFKLFAGCAVASYLIKYGELFFDFPYSENLLLSLALIGVPSALNGYKWYRRSQDPTFEGWF